MENRRSRVRCRLAGWNYETVRRVRSRSNQSNVGEVIGPAGGLADREYSSSHPRELSVRPPNRAAKNKTHRIDNRSRASKLFRVAGQNSIGKLLRQRNNSIVRHHSRSLMIIWVGHQSREQLQKNFVPSGRFDSRWCPARSPRCPTRGRRNPGAGKFCLRWDFGCPDVRVLCWTAGRKRGRCHKFISEFQEGWPLFSTASETAIRRCPRFFKDWSDSRLEDVFKPVSCPSELLNRARNRNIF